MVFSETIIFSLPISIRRTNILPQLECRKVDMHQPYMGEIIVSPCILFMEETTLIRGN